MLRTQPPGEDATLGARGMPVPFGTPGTPPGENSRFERIAQGSLENSAEEAAEASVIDVDDDDDDDAAPPVNFLAIVREAESQASLYTTQANRRAWSTSLRAYHNEHSVGSKYTLPEWRGRSRLFVPKTRTAVRKDQAAVAASLFNNIDAITCLPGNDGDGKQRAGAAIMQELINYRTDRSSGRASMPWFLIAMGARQDAQLTGVCLSKQYWKVEHRKDREEQVEDEAGKPSGRKRDVYTVETDRPDVMLFPSENFVIDSSADWRNPGQSAAFLLLKYPMQIEEIRSKQNAPVNPWKRVSEDVLRSTTEAGKFETASVRRAREAGLDRFDETQTGTHFQIIWVYEAFIRIDGEDWCFYCAGDRAYLTDPKPVREVYPEQFGERPVTLGYGSLESHRIFPMSPVESWQPLQHEVNDLRNLMLDATKQNVMPISKVRRGKRIDLDQIKRRSSGSSILVENPDDVTWEKPPEVSTSSAMMKRELDLELDDLAGQQNYGSVETNNALGKTLGGLKLAAGAANAVQEFDIRVWIETWTAPTLSQVVRLEQYYESDPIVLGLCGERAQLFKKHGINKIDDDLLEQEILVRVSVGLGAGDPMQRLAKFQAATNVLLPLLQNAPDFVSGKRKINTEAIIEEVMGAAGYKDGGDRFFIEDPNPPQNPNASLETDKLRAEIAKNDRMGKAAMMSGLASVAKIALGKRELEASVVDQLLGRAHEARTLGFDHGHRHNQLHLSALDHGHKHGIAIAKHRQDILNRAADATQAGAGGDDDQDMAGDTGAGGPPPQDQGQDQGQDPGQEAGPAATGSQLPPGSQIEFIRDPRTQRIVSARVVAAPPGRGAPAPQPGNSGGGAKPPVGQAATAAAPAEPAKPDPMEERLARLEAIADRLSKPRTRRIVRDGNNRITHVEEGAAA